MEVESDMTDERYVAGSSEEHARDAQRIAVQDVPQNEKTKEKLQKYFSDHPIRQFTQFYAGPGRVIDSISDLISPDAQILVNDMDKSKVDLATTNAHKAGFENIIPIVGEASSILASMPDNSLEGLINIRLGLVFNTKPNEFVNLMAKKMAPGSSVLLEELDVDSWFIAPDSDSFNLLSKSYANFRSQHGLSNQTGSELERNCKKAKLEIIETTQYQTISTNKDDHHIAVALFLNQAIQRGMLDSSVLNPNEAEVVLKQYLKDLDRPGTQMAYPLMTQVLAVKR